MDNRRFLHFVKHKVINSLSLINFSILKSPHGVLEMEKENQIMHIFVYNVLLDHPNPLKLNDWL